MSDLGTLVINEQHIPIVEIFLRDGRIWFKCQSADHSYYTFASGDIGAIFAPDGTMVFKHPINFDLPGKVVHVEDATLTFTWPVQYDLP